MGGRGAGGGGPSSARGKINTELEKIRNARRENLRVFDKNGNVVYAEGGTQGHTGYAETDYRDKIVAHNHPTGYAPYPSRQDIETFETSGAREMIIVSKDYTVSLKKDPSYKSLSGARESIIGARRWTENTSVLDSLNRSRRNGEISVATYNQKKREYEFETYRKAAKRAGYIFTVTKRR